MKSAPDTHGFFRDDLRVVSRGLLLCVGKPECTSQKHAMKFRGSRYIYIVGERTEFGASREREGFAFPFPERNSSAMVSGTMQITSVASVPRSGVVMADVVRSTIEAERGIHGPQLHASELLLPNCIGNSYNSGMCLI